MMVMRAGVREGGLRWVWGTGTSPSILLDTRREHMRWISFEKGIVVCDKCFEPLDFALRVQPREYVLCFGVRELTKREPLQQTVADEIVAHISAPKF